MLFRKQATRKMRLQNGYGYGYTRTSMDRLLVLVLVLVRARKVRVHVRDADFDDAIRDSGFLVRAKEEGGGRVRRFPRNDTRRTIPVSNKPQHRGADDDSTSESTSRVLVLHRTYRTYRYTGTGTAAPTGIIVLLYS
jgi:hypothetical protein